MAVSASCAGPPKLIQYDDALNQQARAAPIVVVGVASSGKSVGRPVPSRNDPDYPMQLRKVNIRVENVLKGSLTKRTINVYYFALGGGFNGPRPLGYFTKPSRRVFWLREDGGVLRLACDGYDYCTMLVATGAHPGYAVDAQAPLNRALADILLTRGAGRINDLAFAREIGLFSPDQGIEPYVIGKLRHLASTEAPAVKASACYSLWIYTHEQVRQLATAALNDARCVCAVQRNGDAICH